MLRYDPDSLDPSFEQEVKGRKLSSNNFPQASFERSFTPVQVSLDGEAIRNEKVKVLQSMSNVQLDDVTLGQYRAR